MSDRYDFANLSPIEFEGLCVDLVEAETGYRFERFAEGADGGIDGRHGHADGGIILQAKHYKNSTWSDLQKAVKAEAKNIARLQPAEYYLLTSQPLTPSRKALLASHLCHSSVDVSRIWGRTEINAFLSKHASVEKRNIKLWLSSATVLDRLLKNDIAVFTEATYDEIERILKVFVVNPSLKKSANILNVTHCLIVSGPPGVGKTTLAQVLAAEYSDDGWELVSITSIDDAFRAYQRDVRQFFVFDDFLGKIRLDPASLSRDDGKIARFISHIQRDKKKRFVLTTRAYILEAARAISEALDDRKIEMSEMVLNLSTYTRELKARILYNHLYHSDIDQESVQALLVGDTVRQIVDHRNYMPRIIQWMTDEIRQRGISPSEYPKAFLQTLENPDKIWDKAFRRHISQNARVLLYCMYFAENERFSEPGARLNKLRVFFDRAVVNFGVVTKDEVRSSLFEETLREVKSSFVVIDGDRANFINPSVQDYLSRESADARVLGTLASAVPSVAGAMSLWKKIDPRASAEIKKQVATALLDIITSGKVDGRGPLHELAGLIGHLILASGQTGYCDVIRRYKSDDLFWIDEGNLPPFIDELDSGRFSNLPHAGAYARYLRLHLHRYVSSDREYAMEIEELASLATALAASKVEMSEEFYKNFETAAEEAVDVLDMDAIGKSEDPEQVIGDWLENIDKIEQLMPAATFSFKKTDFEERVASIQWAQEQREREESVSPMRSHSPSAVTPSSTSFSNADIQSMFSSLRRSD
ncbi:MULTISPECIES: restriction endonuclease [unclassified Rhizobium]|uniref:nSTAND3 domain-containing NTPase n=1 Tax=unclassified Rhizobium TaxID=2613769 RepID=UPI0007F07389|nr:MULTISPECIES: restriction endonuclease [unclassified Rhizobium]ANM11357.1 restriction endonuclease domain-containing protein [Rhizobium sp. N324]OYD04961.1 restriction endonuclease domain-containing protein [Rhizobium sp. N4311]